MHQCRKVVLLLMMMLDADLPLIQKMPLSSSQRRLRNAM
jgi:hypothetical protein